MRGAYVTLLTHESYLVGTLVLAHSLRTVGSKYEVLVMVTPGLSERARRVLSLQNIRIKDISTLKPQGISALPDHDQRFEDTWTKLRVFELAEFDRVVLLDSDMLVRHNIDDLMECNLPGPDWIAACHACTCNPRKLTHYPPDWIPENCAYTPLMVTNDTVPPPVESSPTSPRTYTLLNSGTVLLQPSEELARDIYDFLATSPLVAGFVFPDQDLLTHFFKGRWKPLPYVYNALKTLRIIHKPLWRDELVRCVHYILPDKPWNQPRNTSGAFEAVHKWWWLEYDKVEREIREIDAEIQII